MFVSQAIPTESDFSDLIDSVQATLVASGNIKLSNSSDSTRDFVHQVIIGEKLR